MLLKASIARQVAVGRTLVSATPKTLGLSDPMRCSSLFHVRYLPPFVGDNLIQSSVVDGETPATRLPHKVYLGPCCGLGWPYDIPFQEFVNKGAQCRLFLDSYLSRSQTMRASLSELFIHIDFHWWYVHRPTFYRIAKYVVVLFYEGV